MTLNLTGFTLLYFTCLSAQKETESSVLFLCSAFSVCCRWEMEFNLYTLYRIRVGERRCKLYLANNNNEQITKYNSAAPAADAFARPACPSLLFARATSRPFNSNSNCNFCFCQNKLACRFIKLHLFRCAIYTILVQQKKQSCCLPENV